MGVNRISLGVQSWDDDLLKLLGREHNAAQAEASFQILRDAGFTNVNIDLMFGLPGQTLGAMGSRPRENDRARPGPHLDLLPHLRGRHGVFRRARPVANSAKIPNPTPVFSRAPCGMLEAPASSITRSRIMRAPVSSQSHNRGYWAGQDYLGIGPSAFSTVALERMAERLRLPRLFRPGSGRLIRHRLDRNPHPRDETRRERSPFRFGPETASRRTNSANGPTKAASSSTSACSAKSTATSFSPLAENSSQIP